MDQINEKALQELEEYKKQGCHMMIPTMGSLEALAGGYVMTVSPVSISPHPPDGDVYPHDSKQWDDDKSAWKVKTGNERVRFHAQAFQALADGADIRWSQPAITIDAKFPRVLCEISGAIMKPNGSWRALPDIYGSDLDIIRDELIARYTYDGKFDTKKQWLVDRELLQKRKHQKAAAITGAKNRVTARLLRLKNTYTVSELAKPFIFVQIAFRPDMKDRQIRLMVTQANLLGTALNSLWGRPAEPPAIEYMGPVDAEKCRVGDDVVDMESDGPDHSYTLKPAEPDLPPFAMPKPEEPSMTTAESLRADFLACGVAGQVKTIESLAKTKGALASIPGWLKGFKKTPPATLESIEAEHRVWLYDHLCGLPDKEGGK